MEVRTDSFKKMVCVEGKDLVSASDQAVRHAFKRSPLLKELADEVIPLQINSMCSTLGVVVPSFHKWLAVACGAVCSTADIVDVLRVRFSPARTDQLRIIPSSGMLIHRLMKIYCNV